jgi:CubicO group peptidase (beta-lactamase class C family)
MSVIVNGDCSPRLAALRDVLVEEISAGRAIGLAVAVVQEGRTLAHLWGGHRDEARAVAWTPDTLVTLFSAGKPLVAAAVLDLICRKLVRIDEPVASYWPEFAQAGKASTTVRQLLAHLAGVPALDAAPPGSVLQPRLLVSALEKQAPLWPPGQQLCFHSFTYGLLAGELVRRVSGQPFPDFFRARFARRFGLDLAFALTADEQRRCAQIILVEDNVLFRMMTDCNTALGRSWRPMQWDALNSAEFRSCDFPSIAGHGSALGLARFYSMMANQGQLADERVLEESVVSLALTEQRHELDVFMGAPVRMGLGFMLSNEVFPFLGARSFAQPGLGGVAGVGDREARLGVGIAPNLLASGLEAATLSRVLSIVRASLPSAMSPRN